MENAMFDCTPVLDSHSPWSRTIHNTLVHTSMGHWMMQITEICILLTFQDKDYGRLSTDASSSSFNMAPVLVHISGKAYKINVKSPGVSASLLNSRSNYSSARSSCIPTLRLATVALPTGFCFRTLGQVGYATTCQFPRIRYQGAIYRNTWTHSPHYLSSS